MINKISAKEHTLGDNSYVYACSTISSRSYIFDLSKTNPGHSPTVCVVIVPTEASRFCKIYSSINLISSLSKGIKGREKPLVIICGLRWDYFEITARRKAS